MKAQVVAIDGKKGAEVALPAQFAEAYRPDLIRRAFHSERSFSYQPKGNYPMAGRNYTAEYYGRRHAWRQTINTGRSRVPRVKIPGGRSGRVLTVPSATHGTRAHPPKVQKIIRERINIKEKNFALRSAIAATGVKELVVKRGHKFADSTAFPIIIDASIEQLKKAKEAKSALVALGFEADIERAHKARTMRSGRARLRRGGYRTPSSVLIVIGKDSGIWKAARNLPGVDVVPVEKLTVELLCPGGDAGRLTLWTKDAVDKLGTEKLYM
ncbi:MAG: 50S ribosomal protein L4 [Candidatus Micrarchaeia archaeon]